MLLFCVYAMHLKTGFHGTRLLTVSAQVLNNSCVLNIKFTYKNYPIIKINIFLLSIILIR